MPRQPGSRPGLADCAWEPDTADRRYYRRVLAKAWDEVTLALGLPRAP